MRKIITLFLLAFLFSSCLLSFKPRKSLTVYRAVRAEKKVAKFEKDIQAISDVKTVNSNLPTDYNASKTSTDKKAQKKYAEDVNQNASYDRTYNNLLGKINHWIAKLSRYHLTDPENQLITERTELTNKKDKTIKLSIPASSPSNCYCYISSYNLCDIEDSIGKVDTALKLNRKILSGLTLQNNTSKKINDSISKSKKGSIDSAGISKINKSISDSVKLVQDGVSKLQRDSTRLGGTIKGAQKLQIYLTAYQNFPDVANDDPKGLTQAHLGFNVPLNHLNGKVSCNTWTPVFLRNFYIDGVFTTSSPKNYGPKIDSINKKPYVNLLDLYQFSYFSLTGRLNLVTFIISPKCSPTTDHIYWCIDAMFGVERSNTFSGPKNDSFPTDFGIYGLNSTAVWIIKKAPIIPVFNVQLFWLDPNTNSITPGLNSQYNKLSTDNGSSLTYAHPETYPYANISCTLQYSLSSSSSNSGGNKTPTSSPTSGTTPTIFYANFAYCTNIIFGNGSNGRYHNNFLTLQAGLSLDINNVVNSIQSLLGGSKSSSNNSTN